MTAAPSRRAKRNAENATRNKARALKRITTGSYIFAKAKQEAEHRHFTVLSDEAHWNAQLGVKPSDKKLLVSVKDSDIAREVYLHHIMSGHTCATQRTAAQKASTRLKMQQAHSGEQENWKEAAAIQAAMALLGVINWLPVPDGLAADLVVPHNDGKYVGIQVKSGVEQDGKVGLHVQQVDGDPGGRYVNLIILGVILQYMPPEKVKEYQAAMMADPDHVPVVTIKELFLYKTAADIPGAQLAPCPRRAQDDKYGDTRYVVGFDDPARLQVMRELMQAHIASGKGRSLQSWWFDYGHGTANPVVHTTHVSEMLNCKALAGIVGFKTLSAMLRQGETCDVVWKVSCTEAVRISLKTASVNHGKEGQYYFPLKQGRHSACHVVLAFYVDRETQERTHVSVICPRRVYRTENRGPHSKFYWSGSNNVDVMVKRIDLRQPDVGALILQAARALLVQT